MNLETQSASRDEVISELKRDLQLTLFYLSPELQPGCTDAVALAKTVGFSEADASFFKKRFIASGLWRESDGGISKAEDYLDFGDLTIPEYMSMAVGIISRLSETGPCRYENLVVVTNEELKREFYRQMDKVIREFVEKSSAIKGDTMLALNYAGLDCIKELKSTKEKL